jgi:hypothetical protein
MFMDLRFDQMNQAPSGAKNYAAPDGAREISQPIRAINNVRLTALKIRIATARPVLIN